jgi:hypothetical protein
MLRIILSLNEEKFMQSNFQMSDSAAKIEIVSLELIHNSIGSLSSRVFGIVELSSIQAAREFYDRCRKIPFQDASLEFTPALKGALVFSESLLLKSHQSTSAEIELFHLLHSESPSVKNV